MSLPKTDIMMQLSKRISVHESITSPHSREQLIWRTMCEYGADGRLAGRERDASRASLLRRVIAHARRVPAHAHCTPTRQLLVAKVYYDIYLVSKCYRDYRLAFRRAPPPPLLTLISY